MALWGDAARHTAPSSEARAAGADDEAQAATSSRSPAEAPVMVFGHDAVQENPQGTVLTPARDWGPNSSQGSVTRLRQPAMALTAPQGALPGPGDTWRGALIEFIDSILV